jgi:hypothetical protein
VAQQTFQSVPVMGLDPRVGIQREAAAGSIGQMQYESQAGAA